MVNKNWKQTFPMVGIIDCQSVVATQRRESCADGAWWVKSAGDEATPTQSYFVLCEELPSTLVFGVWNGSPQYQHVFGANGLKDSEGSWQLPEEIAEAIARGQ